MRNVRSVCLLLILILAAALIVLTASPAAAAAVPATTAATTAKPEDEDGGTPWIYIAATILGVGAVGVGAWCVASVIVKNRQKEK